MLTIQHLREQIEGIDREIIRNIVVRQNLCKKIASLKRKAGKPIIDREQEKKIFELYDALSREYAVDPQFIIGIFRLIIINSRAIQQKL